MEETVESTETYFKLLNWLHANRKPLVIGGVIIAVIAVAWAIISWQKSETESEADAQLMNTPLASLQQGRLEPTPATPFLDIAKQYPNTPAGEYADLLGAERLFIAGKYADAHQQFSAFAEQNPDSPLIAQAKYGIAACLEGEGKLSDAAAKYQEVVSSYPTDPGIAAPARLTLARLDEQLNRVEQALTIYEQLAQSKNPYDPWAAEAQERGMALLMKHPELRRPPPGSQPTGMPPGAAGKPGLGNITIPKSAPIPAPKTPQAPASPAEKH